ncbi:MAG: hypothetical protein WKF67_00860 [Rubrobacteraceae bacterium]
MEGAFVPEALSRSHPLDVETLLREAPELRLARNQAQGPFHHLDTLEHILETAREWRGS